MSNGLRFSDLVANPEFFLHELKLAEGQALFVEITRDSFKKSAFMDGRIAFTRNRRHGIALQDLMQAYASQPVPLRPADFIFHLSFCCSTLLSRALHVEGRLLSIREPYALIDLAHHRRSWGDRPPPQNWQALLGMTLNLLAKSYRDDERVLIKPSNIANALIEDLLSLRAHSRAILMYCDLRSYLVANLKKEEATRRKMWWLAGMFAQDSDLLHGEALDIDGLSHPQVVALLWHLQMYRFAGLLRGTHAERLVSLDAATLLEDPRSAIARAFQFLGVGRRPDDIDAVLAGPVFSTHAKNPYASYGRQQRERENAEVASRHAADIEAALAWSRERFGARRIGPTLSRPLVPSG